MLLFLSKFHSEPAKENLRSWFTNKHVCMHVSVYMDMRVCVCACACAFMHTAYICVDVFAYCLKVHCALNRTYTSLSVCMQPHHPDLKLFLRWTDCQVSGLLHGERPTSTTLLSFWAGTIRDWEGWSDQKLNKCQRLSATEFPRCTVRHRCVCWWPEPQIAQAAEKETKTPGWFRTILNTYPAKWKHLFWRGKRPSLVGDQVGAVEADTELTNHANVTSRSHRFHERLSSWLCDGAQVVDQFVLCHANARILDGQGGVRLVGDDLDEEVGLGLRNANFFCPFLAQNG